MSLESTASSSANRSAISSRAGAQNRCTHSTVDGRRCRLPVANAATGLCFRHFELRDGRGAAPDPETVADELLGSIEDFSSADSINLFLGNLVKQLVRKRIARPDAIALAYIGQLLLNTLPALRREEEAEREDLASQYLLQAFERKPPSEAPSGEPEPGFSSSRQ